MKIILTTLLSILVGAMASSGRLDAGDKYALLIGVTQYQHARMNNTPLMYPEDDARAVAELLKASGYSIDLLLGKSASNQSIKAALEKLSLQGTQEGVVIVGLFGHGVQYDEDAFFCGYDTSVRIVTDAQGRKLRDKNGQPKLEPNPESMTSMRYILDTLTTCGAGGKLLLADCCREDPSAARGRAFGSKLRVSQLPAGTVALFACSVNERAYEHADWKHGAFTRAFLDQCKAAGSNATAAGLYETIQREVNDLVAEKLAGRGRQNVHGLLNGNVRLQLLGRGRVKLSKPGALSAPFSLATASKAQQRWSAYLGQPVTASSSLGTKLKLIPPGSFQMGSTGSSRAANESPHTVQITQPVYVSLYETTVGEFTEFVDATGYQTTLERTDDGSNRGWDESRRRFSYERGFSWRTPGWQQQDDHPVVNVTWEDAKAFVTWLSNRDKDGNRYRLLTEAEWEYCCRAGTTTTYSVGKDPKRLVEVGNILDSTGMSVFRQDAAFQKNNASDAIRGRDGAVFTTSVGSYRANSFGLYDFHGNVCEWCNDWYADNYGDSRGKNPQGALYGSDRCARGGRFDTGKYLAKSSTRNHGSPLMSDMILGFRIAREIN